MKQPAALFLTFLFLFNLAGYRLFFNYLQQKSDAQYEYSLDNNSYDESNMLTVKVDLDMPYLAENTSFERVDGEITVDGKIYKYVKRKIHNGQLVLLCLPDEKKTRLRSSREEYFFYANNLASHSDSKQSVPKAAQAKNVATDYDQNYLDVNFGCLPSIIHYQLPMDEAIPSFADYDLPAQPPELS